MRIDLHAHSTCSDGTSAPARLIQQAAQAGLDVVALTDHDTLAGLPEARAEAEHLGLGFVPGIEMSCRWYAPSPPIAMHLLAYHVDPGHSGLQAELARVRDARVVRAKAIIELMRSDGLDVTWDEVQADAAGGTVGRPHLAQAVIRRGLAADVSAAFAPQMLGRRWRVPKSDIDIFLALELVAAAGGVAVLAHPRASSRGRVVPDELIEQLAAAGLAGLEVEHTDHDLSQRAQLRALAGRLDLLTTGSSDYHGRNKPVELGAFVTDPQVLVALEARRGGGR